MSYRPTRSWPGGGGGGILGLPPAISQILMANVIIFLLQPLVLQSFMHNGLALVPSQVVTRGMVWELVTYMFLHANFMHIFFNMFALVMFGSDLERWWGSRDFVKYYFITGIGAGLAQIVTSYLFPGSPVLTQAGWVTATGIGTIGASGAVFGVLIAFGMAFPQRQVLLFFVLPISARMFVILFGILELTMAVHYPHGGVARFAHLGGMLVGYVYLKHEMLLWRAKRWLGSVQRSRGPRMRGPSSHQDDVMKEEIDRILGKISREGMGSLTKEERRVLAESADRARKRQQGDPQ